MKIALIDAVVRPLRMSVAQLEEGLVAHGTRLYAEDATRRRRDAFERKLDAAGARPGVP